MMKSCSTCIHFKVCGKVGVPCEHYLEVIRCEECVYAQEYVDFPGLFWCTLRDYDKTREDFCSEGFNVKMREEKKYGSN